MQERNPEFFNELLARAERRAAAGVHTPPVDGVHQALLRFQHAVVNDAMQIRYEFSPPFPIHPTATTTSGNKSSKKRRVRSSNDLSRKSSASFRRKRQLLAQTPAPSHMPDENTAVAARTRTRSITQLNTESQPRDTDEKQGNGDNSVNSANGDVVSIGNTPPVSPPAPPQPRIVLQDVPTHNSSIRPEA